MGLSRGVSSPVGMVKSVGLRSDPRLPILGLPPGKVRGSSSWIKERVEEESVGVEYGPAWGWLAGTIGLAVVVIASQGVVAEGIFSHFMPWATGAILLTGTLVLVSVLWGNDVGDELESGE